MSIDVETTATDMSVSPGTPPPNGAIPVPATHPPAGDAEDQARLATARAIVGILRRSVIDPRIVDLVLDADRARTPEGSARARVIVNGADALARLLAPPTPDAFADAFLRGDIEIEGDVMAAVEAGQAADLRRLRPSDARRLLRWTLALRRGRVPAAPLRRVARLAGSRHSPARDMAAVRFHYDVGNAFYGLWLDRRLTYSCAYFPDDTTAQGAASGLDAAQEAKLELISRKLRLSPGMRLLDIGCGWGSLVGLAAERHATESVGVTLSERQADEANARFRAAEVDGLARALVLDYRDLAGLGPFDAVASVGMFEHVGQDNLAAYFRAAHEALRPGGLFLNHGIARSGGSRARPPAGVAVGSTSFLERYVFPDGELVPVEVAVAVARASGFEVVDVQSLRPHYALTLAAWVARLEASWDAAVAAAGEEVARAWRLYMSAARLGFERGDLDVCQLLLAKPVDGRRASLPLRPWW